MYKIIAKSKYGTEEIDSTNNRKNAEYLVKEYSMAYGIEFTIYIK